MRTFRVLVGVVVIAMSGLAVPETVEATCGNCRLNDNKYYCEESGNMNYRCRSAPLRIYCSGCDEEIDPSSIGAALAFVEGGSTGNGACQQPGLAIRDAGLVAATRQATAVITI